MKRLLLLTTLFLCLATAGAEVFTVDGIKYGITSTDNLTVEVLYPGSVFPGDGYSGEVDIPKTVEYNNKYYSVTSIGLAAFYQCSGLTSVTIPNSVTSIGRSAFYNCSGLTSVTIPNSVTTIEDWAFSGCSSLTSATIPNSVTTIVDGAFCNCSSLTTITIPNSVTSIGERVFEGCNGLTSIIVETGNPVYDSRNNCNAIIKTATNELIAGFNNTDIPNSVTSIGNWAFSYCSGLTTVTIPNSVTSIGQNAFFQCSGLTSVTIPNSVTSIGDYAFSGCSGLTSVIVGWETPLEIEELVFQSSSYQNATLYVPKGTKSAYEAANVWKDFDSIVEMFDKSDGELSDSQGVKYTANDDESTCYVSGHESNYSASIVIPEAFGGRRVTSIKPYAFLGCKGLTAVTIGSSVTGIGNGAFNGCNSLTAVTIPNSVTSIGGYAFENCSGLTAITIPNSVTSIGEYAFYGCSNLTSITIPNSVTGIGSSAFGACSGLTTISIPNSVTSIGNYAFAECSGLTAIDVDSDNSFYDSRNNCNAIIETSSNTLIAGCQNTEIPNSVTGIGNGAFNGNKSLTSIIIPNSVISLGNRAFRDCSSLISVTIPNSVATIGDEVFRGCNSLASVTIPNSVTTIGSDILSDCSGLTSICVDLDNNTYDSRNNCNAIIEKASNTLIAGCQNTEIPNSVTGIAKYAFASCSGLTSITIPNSVTSIGDRAFTCCHGLTSITIPNSVTSIGDEAFAGCSSLTSIAIPNGVTSIGDLAFYGCSNLTSITISKSVTSAGYKAFSGCNGLTSVIVGWDTPLWLDSFAFGESNNQNVILYVPKGTKTAYEAANVWKDFGTIFECDLPQENVEATDVSAIDNVIYIDPLEVTRGTEVTVPLQMKNTAGVRGFQFDMYLPLGVTVKKDGNNRFICSLNDDRKPSGSVHTLTVSEQQDGAIRFLCGSQYDETFTGTEGEILTVQLCVDEKMLAGLYPIILKNVKLTETNINNFYLTETVQTALNVIPYIPGDISGDGVIDVSDYIGVANYILGTPQTGITAAAADVNKDNLVDVSDYIGVANLILYNNIYGQTANASRRWQKRANTDVSALNNVVYITPFETTSNSEMQVSVKMKNTVGIRGFQFDLYLPEGITAKKDGNNRIVCSLNNGRKPNGDQHTLTMSEQPDGAIRFLCGSQYDETFTGSDGEIATLTISVAADVEADNYPIYLRNMKLTETDINNYYTTDEIETSVTVTGPADGRVVLDEASTTAPEAANGVDVRVKRTINANEWSTICLPFAMSATQVKAAFGDDVQLADFTSYDTVEDTGENVVGLTVNFNMVTAMEANHPYVIKVSNAISEFTADNVTIDPEEEPCVEYDNGLTGKRRVVWGSFTGTYVADCVIPYEGDDVSLFLSGNKWWYATAQTKHMKGYRAYFWFTDLLPDVSASRIQMAFNDETANVVELKDGRMEELKSYYNLKGQRVEKPLKKGLYIRNGKKVIIK